MDHSTPLILIAMAGRGTRLAGADGALPKPLVRAADGRPLVDWAVRGLRQALPRADWLFVCLRGHLDRWPMAAALLQAVAPATPAIEVLEAPTAGQLATVLAARRHFEGRRGPLIVHNCDTFVSFDADPLAPLAGGWDGALAVFQSRVPALSYVDLAADGRVRAVLEKQVLPAGLASSGTHLFARGQDLISGAEEVIGSGAGPSRELYLSQVYGPLLARGQRHTVVPAGVALPMGTGEELATFNRWLGDNAHAA